MKLSDFCTPEQANALAERIDYSSRTTEWSAQELAETIAELLAMGVPAVEMICWGSDCCPWSERIMLELWSRRNRILNPVGSVAQLLERFEAEERFAQQ